MDGTAGGVCPSAPENSSRSTVICVGQRLEGLLTSLEQRAHLRRGRRRVRTGADAFDQASLVPVLVKPMEGRTGSTLLMNLLGTSKDIAFDRVYPFEHRYLTYLARLVTAAGEPFDADGDWDVGELLEGRPDRIGPIPFVPRSLDPSDLRRRLTRHAWAAFSESVLAFSGLEARFYAEKTWGNSLELLAEAGITAKVIPLVRDPRDVVASIRAFDRKRGTFGFGRTSDQTESEYLEFILGVMRVNLREMDDIAESFECLLVKYEDLVADLSGVADRLSAFLGTRLDASRRDRLERYIERHATTGNVQSSVGRWKTDLDPAESRRVQQVLGDYMVRLGYVCDDVTSALP